MRWWQEPFGTEEEGVAFGAFGAFGRSLPRGNSPALLVIDVVRSFVGPPCDDLREIVDEWPLACGPEAHRALAPIATILSSARTARSGAGIPIIHFRPGIPSEFGPTAKADFVGDGTLRNRDSEFVPEAQPTPNEMVFTKSRASAFFNSPIATYLHGLGVDTLLIAGCSTSGCVRATVVDAFSHGFAPLVLEEAVFDRSQLLAAASLFDMNAKYADVIELADAIGWLAGLPGVDEQA